ncbi:MAG: AAA family ATPase [Clostridia bacterium]|nr:AAA family ATPase [Clostridia bacterium]
MRLIKARVQGYRSIIDTGYFEVENDKTILVGPNEAGKTAILQALQKLNPPEGVALFDPLRDYPRSKYDEDIKNGNIDSSTFTVVEGHFALEDDDRDELPEAYKDVIYVCGRYLDNTMWHRLDNAPSKLIFSEIEKDLLKICQHYKNTSVANGDPEAKQVAIQTGYDTAVLYLRRTSVISSVKAKQITTWLKNNLVYLEDDNATEEKRYEKLLELLEKPIERNDVLTICEERLPKFILFSNYFRIKPVLHLKKLAERIDKKMLDDEQYDYGNICLLKFLGFTPKELAEAGETSKYDLNKPDQYEQYRAQLDKRDYQLNAATIRLTDAICEIWNPKKDGRDANKLRIKVDGQYLKVVVEDDLGVEVELDQRSEGFQWMVSFYVVFFAEASDKHKNAILLLDEPGQSLHALKQAEFIETLTKLSKKNQTLYTTHSPFLVGTDELDKVRVVEMTDRTTGTKVNLSLTASDSGAMLPLQEALGYDLAQSLFFHKKNLVLEGLTDMWYIESLSELFKADGKTGINEQIALIPANCASKVVYFATILHAQNLKISALLDSDAEGELAAKQETLINAVGAKRILRTKDVYSGQVSAVEIEDILRDTLLNIAKDQCGWDAIAVAKTQAKRPIVDVLKSVAKADFSKYKLSKAFIRWSRDHGLNDLQPHEIAQAGQLIEKINKSLQ